MHFPGQLLKSSHKVVDTRCWWTGRKAWTIPQTWQSRYAWWRVWKRAMRVEQEGDARGISESGLGRGGLGSISTGWIQTLCHLGSTQVAIQREDLHQGNSEPNHDQKFHFISFQDLPLFLLAWQPILSMLQLHIMVHCIKSCRFPNPKSLSLNLHIVPFLLIRQVKSWVGVKQFI